MTQFTHCCHLTVHVWYVVCIHIYVIFILECHMSINIEKKVYPFVSIPTCVIYKYELFAL